MKLKQTTAISLLICIFFLFFPTKTLGTQTTLVFNSEDAFTLEHNNGPNWFWQSYDVKTGQYITMTNTSSASSNKNWWVDPNPWNTDIIGRVDSGNVYAAVSREIMYPENLKTSQSNTRYAVRTFVSLHRAQAIITNSGDFAGAASGWRKAKIMLNDKQIWPTDGSEWNAVKGWNKFDFPASGISVKLNPGDKIHFIISRCFDEDTNDYYYNSQARWVPVVTLIDPVLPVSKTYQASSDFSTETKSDIWSYESSSKDYPVATHTYSYGDWGTAWTFGYPDHTRGAIGADWIMPDQFPEWDNENIVISRVFTSPYASSNVIIKSSDGKITGKHWQCDSLVRIMKNNTVLWPTNSETGWVQITGTSSVSIPEIRTSLSVGDKIYFSINKNGTNYNDRVTWDPIIILPDCRSLDIEEDEITLTEGACVPLAFSTTTLSAMPESLDTSIARVVKVGKTWYVQALRAGVTELILTDGNANDNCVIRVTPTASSGTNSALLTDNMYPFKDELIPIPYVASTLSINFVSDDPSIASIVEG